MVRATISCCNAAITNLVSDVAASYFSHTPESSCLSLRLFSFELAHARAFFAHKLSLAQEPRS